MAVAALSFRGNFEQGFKITLQISADGDPLPVGGTLGDLPGDPLLLQAYQHWQLCYRQQFCYPQPEQTSRQIRSDPTYPSNFSIQEAEKCLKRQFRTWLKADSFRAVQEKVRSQLAPTDTVRLLIKTDNLDLCRLPWHLWDFFEDYPLAEPAFCPLEYRRPPQQSQTPRDRVKILAIFGSSDGIDIDTDRRLLQALPEAEIVFLKQPQRQEVNDQLWEQGWDILFFAGHSETRAETGIIQLNAEDSLSLLELKHGLRRAIQSGLQFAIFNSCDGLGLAWELASLQLPQIVAMREPVRDQAAQKFLKYFLEAFSSGEPFYLAVRQARERLQGRQRQFPYASWLPTIFQNPTVVPPTWQGLCPQRERISAPVSPGASPAKPLRGLRSLWVKIRLFWNNRHGLAVKVSLGVTVLVLVLRFLGWLQPSELQAFDRLMRQRPPELPDERILIVKATDEDIKEEKERRENQASLSDRTLAQVFEKLQPYEPIAIGLDIYRDFPADPKSKLEDYLKQNNVWGTCKVSLDKRDDGVAHPPEIPPDRLGFSDVIEDEDGVLRRHLLAMKVDATDPCGATAHLSFNLALDYLQKAEGISWDYTSPDQKEVKIGSVVLKEVQSRYGGYQNVDARGRQILLNYRALESPAEIATTLTVEDLLSDLPRKEKLAKLKHRLVLIGIAGKVATSSDYWPTPYKEMLPGVVVQAHMVSQILSAVLDGRSLLWVWSQWGEALWILAWAGLGGILPYLIRWWSGRHSHKLIYLGLLTALALAVLYGLCYGFMQEGGWVPLVPAAIALVSAASSTAMGGVIRPADQSLQAPDRSV